MTKDKPTLADMAIRESLRPKTLAIPAALGQRIAAARKFVLDENASMFLSDLSHAAYADVNEEGKTAKEINAEISAKGRTIAERCRVLSRLPHAATWIEYDGIAFKKQSNEVYGKKIGYITAETDSVTGRIIAKRNDEPEMHPDNLVPMMGWLMETVNDTTFAVTLVIGGVKDTPPIALPCMFVWTTDDSVPPVKSVLDVSSKNGMDPADDTYLALGIYGWNSPHIKVARTKGMSHISDQTASVAMVEYIGELRFIWALLSTINDIPVGVRQMKPNRGFVARGRLRRFVEHSVISILIPKTRDPQSFAKHIVAISRRRAHMVRGHWRRDWRHEGNKIWISEHQRGDSSLGFVLHDYAVKHETDGESHETETV